MKFIGILILSSILTTIALIISGTFLIIDSLIHSSGYLFEGAVFLSMGVILSILLLITSILGRTIKTFIDIYTQQIKMQKVIEGNNSKSKSNFTLTNISDILNNASPDSITITNLNTGETTSSPIDNIFPNDIIKSFLNNIIADKKVLDDSSLDKLSIEQLETELAKAVKGENFELAQSIKEQIKRLKEGN
jgi:excinuclease UvrABC helicase subunit UvrB